MKTVVSVCVAFSVTIMTAIIAGFLCHGVNPSAAWFSFCVGVFVGLLAWIGISKMDGTGIGYNGPEVFFPRGFSAWTGCKNWGWIHWGMISVLAIYIFRAFFFVFYDKGPDMSFQYTWNYGDLSFHLNFANYLAKGAPFWPDFPIYPGIPFTYPFSVDFFSGLLTLVGMSITKAFTWMGVFGAIGVGIALWRWGGPFALAGFLFNGGMAGFAFFSKWEVLDYNDAMPWKSLALGLLITQRGLLYAIPVGLVLFCAWRSRFLYGKAIMPVWVEVLLYSTMPALHMHTFVFLSFLLGVWVLILPARWQVLRLICHSLMPGTILFFLFAGGPASGSGFLHWHPGWMQDPKDPLGFWFMNFGILPFCVLALIGFLCFLLLNSKQTAESKAEAGRIAAFLIPGVLMFTLTYFISFSHWEWDNTKLMMWSVFCVLPGLWFLLKRFHLIFRSAICFVLFFSGCISLFGGLRFNPSGFPLITREEWDTVQSSLRQFPIETKFAAVPIFCNPLTLVGHKTAVGYPGHILGIDLGPRLGDVEGILSGAEDWQERVKRLGVDYIFWGTQERMKYPDAKKPWAETSPAVVTNTWVTIYDVRHVRAGQP